MSKQFLTTDEARARLARNEAIGPVAAFNLRRAGETVPDHLIEYPADEPVGEEDDDKWVQLQSVPLTLRLPADIAQWLMDLDEPVAGHLASQLIEQFYRLREQVTP